MCVEDVFKIAGRGTVVCGEIGIPISVGDQICVVDEAENTIEADIICKGIEKLHKLVNEAEPGETVGLLLDIKSDTIKKGMLLKRK